MRNTMRWGLAVLGLTLCGVGVAVFFLWPARSPGPLAGAKNVKWHEVEMVVGGKKAIITIGKFAKPLPHKTVPIGETRRDTPLDTWVSIRSHALAGKDADDLDRYASHFLDPNYLLDFVRDKVKLSPEDYFEKLRKTNRGELDLVANEVEKVKLSPEDYFEKLRKTNRRPVVIGLIKYGDYTLVVRRHKGVGKFAQYTYTGGPCLVKKGQKYYIDEQAKETDPVLKDLWKELSDSKFKIIDELQ